MLKITDTGAPTVYDATATMTGTESWHVDITFYFRLYGNISLGIVSHDGSTLTTQSIGSASALAKDTNLYNLLIELEAQVTDAADTMTLDAILVNRF